MGTLRRGLRGRVVLALLVAFIPLIALEAYLLDAQAAVLRERVLSERALLARSLADEADTFIAGRFATLRALANTRAIRDPSDGVVDRTIRAVIAEDPTWVTLGLSDADGWNISSVTAPAHSVNVSDRDYFQGAIAGRPTVGAALLARSTGQKTLVIAVPVTTVDGQRIVLSGALALADLEAQLERALPATVTLRVVDRRGQQFIGAGIGDAFPVVTDLPGVAAALLGQSGALIGSGNVVAYANAPTAGWALALAQPTTAAFAEIDRQRGVALALAAAATIAALGVAVYLGGRLELTYARERDRLGRILDEMPVAVALYDKEGRVTLRNAYFREEFGGANAPMTIGEIPAFFRSRDPEGRPLNADDLATARALRGEIVRNERFVFDNPLTGEPVDAVVTALPVHESGGIDGALVLFQDISDLTRLDRQRGAFFDMAAHEIKTPLTALLGHIQLARRHAGQGRWERVAEAVARAEQGGHRLAELVRDLLDVSRLDAGRLELARMPIDLGSLVAEVVEEIRPGLEHHELVLHGDGAPLVADVDPRRVTQILQNLLDNAIRYSPSGGRIEVTAGRDGSEALVRVSDRGIGIPDDEQARIFDRFFRTSRAQPYGGTGLGLFISRRIAEMHGGRLDLEASSEHGSTFVLRLPLAHVGAAATDRAPEAAAASGRSE